MSVCLETVFIRVSAVLIGRSLYCSVFLAHNSFLIIPSSRPLTLTLTLLTNPFLSLLTYFSFSSHASLEGQTKTRAAQHSWKI